MNVIYVRMGTRTQIGSFCEEKTAIQTPENVLVWMCVCSVFYYGGFLFNVC